VRWRREDEPEPLGPSAPEPTRARVAPTAVDRPDVLTVKSEREVWLEGEIYRLRQRVEELDGSRSLGARLQRLRGRAGS
jgi:hypothetical protein